MMELQRASLLSDIEMKPEELNEDIQRSQDTGLKF